MPSRLSKPRRAARRTIGPDLVQAAAEMLAHARGELPGTRTVVRRISEVQVSAPPIWTQATVRAVRTQHRWSQAAFARLLNVSAATVRAWEQGHRVPDGASARLLEVAQRAPDALQAIATGAPADP